MIRREGDRMVVSGALTLANVAAVLGQGNAVIGEGVRNVDLGEVGELDSSALARTNPATTLIKVVLPAPLGPSRPKNSPSSM